MVACNAPNKDFSNTTPSDMTQAWFARVLSWKRRKANGKRGLVELSIYLYVPNISEMSSSRYGKGPC